jgi:hypothetical protein
MRPPRPSEIAVNLDEITRPSAYERACRMLRIGEFVNFEIGSPAKLIVNVARKPQRDSSTVSDQAVAQAVLYRKKYSDY